MYLVIIIMFCVNAGFSKFMVDYDEKIKQSTTSKVLLGLGWSIDELSHLNDIGRSLLIELQQVFDILSDLSAVNGRH